MQEQVHKSPEKRVGFGKTTEAEGEEAREARTHTVQASQIIS